MEIGIKIFPSDVAYGKKIAKYCDFLEVMAIPGTDFKKLRCFSKPMTIHTIHARWGVNLADSKKNKVNRLAVSTAIKAADILDAETIVIHPGQIENSYCDVDNAIKIISGLDSRFVIENMPHMAGSPPYVGGSYDELKMILREAKKSMCLDFPHAAIFALNNGLDYKRFIGKLMSLRPRYFHISDTRIKDRKDMHLHLKEGDLDLSYIEDILPDKCRVAIEDSHDFRKQHKDIEILRNIS
jgi:endonuclease IV